ncbi:MAG: LapA family protein [Bradyrhizobium sp.]|uniref:LapA family protein n=1 Tax=Bradyrhizobium sp. TaxID=376 RepID=UPI003D1177E5
MTRVSLFLALFVAVVAFGVALAGCMSHEQGLQMHREIREHEQRIDRLEAVLGEPAPPEWQARNGDGR